MMNIYLNGELIETESNSVLELIQTLDLDGKRFAVEMNEQIISKSKFADTPLTEHAKIEIIQAVGGG